MFKFVFSVFLFFSVTHSHAEIAIDKAELLNKQLAEIDQLYGNTAALLKNLEIQTTKQKQNLARIHAEIQSLTIEINKQNDELSGQIKTMYAMGHKERLKLLLNQQDPVLTSRMLTYYDYLNAKRVNQLNDTSETLRHLEQLKKQNETETAQLEQNLAQKRLEQNSAQSLKKQRTQLLRHAEPDFLSNEQQINRLKDSENALKNLLSNVKTSSSDLNEEIEKARAVRNKRLEAEEALQLSELAKAKIVDEEPIIPIHEEKNPPAAKSTETIEGSFPILESDFVKLKGQLPFPIQGELIQKFGTARSGTDTKLDGVIIAAPEGTEIHSITDGKVVYSGWMRGYGNIIIIDHGKGYMSLYAFNQSLYKKVHEIVHAGDVIASVGLSGGHDSASLYFGIRKNTKPVNPVEWCK